MPPPRYKLPARLEQCLASLSQTYAVSGERLLQEIIVNAGPSIDEGVEHDNLDGGVTGHAIVLSLSNEVFAKAVKTKRKIQEQLRRDLNESHNVRGEYFSDVLLEAKQESSTDWRADSGLLASGKISPSVATQRAIWGPSGFRVFISHLSTHRNKTGEFKASLAEFGASGFVAHKDIRPTKEWEIEMKSALASMDCFVALMTEKFHESNWTDQEAGFAVARGVPIIAVNLGQVPYGFLGKYQALTSTWGTLIPDIIPFLFEHDRMFGEFMKRLNTCNDWDVANRMSKVFPAIKELGEDKVDALIQAYNTSSTLRKSFGFNGQYTKVYGYGLRHYANKWSQRSFAEDSEGIAERTPF